MNQRLRQVLMNSVVTDGTGRFVGREGRGPPLARYVGGVWMPLDDQYMVAAMCGTQHRLVDSRLTYQYAHLERALHEVPLNRRAVAVDAGAHVGLWSMHLVKVFATVVAFEPLADLAAIYRYNVDTNVAVLHDVALSNINGSLRIHRSRENSGHNVVLQHGSTRVSARRLDDYKLPACDFLKLDVEGHELAALEGAVETISRFRPVICVEHNGLETLNGGARGEALAFLSRLGAREVCRVGADIVFRWP